MTIQNIAAIEPLASERSAEPVVHHAPKGFSDRFALAFTKLLRFTAHATDIRLSA